MINEDPEYWPGIYKAATNTIHRLNHALEMTSPLLDEAEVFLVFRRIIEI
jgi:hypothetical protein